MLMEQACRGHAGDHKDRLPRQQIGCGGCLRMVLVHRDLVAVSSAHGGKSTSLAMRRYGKLLQNRGHGPSAAGEREEKFHDRRHSFALLQGFVAEERRPGRLDLAVERLARKEVKAVRERREGDDADPVVVQRIALVKARKGAIEEVFV